MAFPAPPAEEMMTTPLIMQQTTRGQAICPYCGVGCRLWMESADGKLIRVKGVDDAPANLRGHGTAANRRLIGAGRAQRAGDRRESGTLRAGYAPTLSAQHR